MAGKNDLLLICSREWKYSSTVNSKIAPECLSECTWVLLTLLLNCSDCQPKFVFFLAYPDLYTD